ASVAEGTTLAFETTVRHAAGDKPQIANLSWRVLDSAGRPIPGLAKDEQVAEAGTTKQYQFRFRLGSVPDGAYRVVFAHTPVLDQTQAITAESGFTVSQAVRIARLVVSPDAAATQHAETLYVEQIPHLFAYFSAVDVPTVTVDFVVRAAKDGAEKYRQRTERAIKPDETETRVGLRLDPGIVREGDDLIFAVALTGPDGAAVSREIPFAVRGHTATITLASRLTSNEPASFRIEAPAYFAPPLRVDLQPSSATASLTGATTGTLVAVSDARGGNGSLRATVTDAQGRVARAMASFVIAPPQPVAPPPVVAAAPPPRAASDDWVTALDSTQAPQAPPPPEPSQPAGPTIAEALATFQSQVAQIQADKQAGLDAIQENQQTQMQNFLSGLNQPQQQQQQPQQQAGRRYWAVSTHAIIPGVPSSERTSNTCTVVEAGNAAPTPCGKGRCPGTPFTGDGATLCGRWGAFSSFTDARSFGSAGDASARCSRVMSSPTGDFTESGSNTFWCGD
ncbi:MAG: hypothetical protein IT566_10780, partial [Rhodospirillaceae bacterium]|nr:hypothetical protein [Rhodospirillaceae bacterium]